MNSIPKTVSSLRIIDNPDMEALRQMARYEENYPAWQCKLCHESQEQKCKKHVHCGKRHQYRCQAAGSAFADALSKAQEVQEYLKERKLIRLDKKDGGISRVELSLQIIYNGRICAHPFMWDNTLFDIEDKNAEPDFVSIFVPEWPERLIFLDPLAGVTYILGTDYFGECKSLSQNGNV